MPNKSVPQLDPVTTLLDADLFHIVTANIDKKITAANVKAYINGADSSIIYEAELDITSAELLVLNGTPKLFIAAPEAGYYIELLSVTCLTPVTIYDTPYATNTALSAYTDTATKAQFTGSGILAASVYRNSNLGLVSSSSLAATDTQHITGKAVYVRVDTGNPTAGDYDIKVYATYRIVQE